MQEESLKNKTLKGIGWSAIDNVAGYAVTFVVGIILARLLSPEDYGLLGLIGIFTAICSCFINAGFGTALIRKKDATDDDYNTVFIFNILMSISLYAIMFFCAPLIAKFFGRVELIALTRVATLDLIISSLAIVQRTRLTKRIDFKTQTKITVISAIFRSIVGISAAFAGAGVWALVAQSLSGSLVTTILFCFANRWMPSMRFSKNSFIELFGFSSKLLASSLIDTIWKEIYQVVIGKCYTPATLGQYTRATMFSGMLSSNITSIVQRVTFPVLSQVQDEPERLKDGYRRIIKMTMLITFVSMLMLAVVAKPLITVLIGEKWLPAATFLQIICFGSMLYPLHAINLNMLQVQGRSDLFLKLEILKKIFAIGPILLGIFISIYWMLLGSVFTGFVSFYLNAYYSGPFLKYSVRDQIKDTLPSFFVGMGAAVIAYIPLLAYNLWGTNISWHSAALLILLIQCIIGTLFTILLCERFQLDEYKELKDILKKFLLKVKKQ